MGLRKFAGLTDRGDGGAGLDLLADALEKLAGVPVDGGYVVVMLDPDGTALELAPVGRDDAAVEDGCHAGPGGGADFNVGMAACGLERLLERPFQRAFEAQSCERRDAFGGTDLLFCVDLLDLDAEQRVAGPVSGQVLFVEGGAGIGQAHRIQGQGLAARNDPLDVGHLEGPEVDHLFERVNLAVVLDGGLLRLAGRVARDGASQGCMGDEQVGQQHHHQAEGHEGDEPVPVQLSFLFCHSFP